MTVLRFIEGGLDILNYIVSEMLACRMTVYRESSCKIAQREIVHATKRRHPGLSFKQASGHGEIQLQSQYLKKCLA